MASSGPNLPTAATASATAPYDDINWTEPQKIYLDGQAAITTSSFDINLYSYQIRATGFGFSISPGSTIAGITVTVNRKYANGAVKDAQIQLTKDGTSAAGDNKSAGSTWTTAPTSVNFGGTSDLWNTSWTAAEVNASTFGVLFACQAAANDADAYVDYITVTVEYIDTPVQSQGKYNVQII
jgi:hypothetical protein